MRTIVHVEYVDRDGDVRAMPDPIEVFATDGLPVEGDAVCWPGSQPPFNRAATVIQRYWDLGALNRGIRAVTLVCDLVPS